MGDTIASQKPFDANEQFQLRFTQVYGERLASLEMENIHIKLLNEFLSAEVQRLNAELLKLKKFPAPVEKQA